MFCFLKRSVSVHTLQQSGFSAWPVDMTGRGTVLVVEDDDDVRLELREALEYEGYEVLASRHGTQALEILRAGAAATIRLIILDLSMPSMSGWELIEVLRHDATLTSIPVVVATGVRGRDASEVGRAVHWLRKPYGLDELLDTVRKALGRALSNRPPNNSDTGQTS